MQFILTAAAVCNSTLKTAYFKPFSMKKKNGLIIAFLSYKCGELPDYKNISNDLQKVSEN